MTSWMERSLLRAISVLACAIVMLGYGGKVVLGASSESSSSYAVVTVTDTITVLAIGGVFQRYQIFMDNGNGVTFTSTEDLVLAKQLVTLETVTSYDCPTLTVTNTVPVKALPTLKAVEDFDDEMDDKKVELTSIPANRLSSSATLTSISPRNPPTSTISTTSIRRQNRDGTGGLEDKDGASNQRPKIDKDQQQQHHDHHHHRHGKKGEHNKQAVKGRRHKHRGDKGSNKKHRHSPSKGVIQAGLNGIGMERPANGTYKQAKLHPEEGQNQPLGFDSEKKGNVKHGNRRRRPINN